MSFRVPSEFREVREKTDKVVSFWHRRSVIARLDTMCSVSHVERSKILRSLVDLFLNDDDLQKRILEGINNG